MLAMNHEPETPQCKVPFSDRGDTGCEHDSLDGDHSLSKNPCKCTALYSVDQYSHNVDHQEAALFREAVGYIDEYGRPLSPICTRTSFGRFESEAAIRMTALWHRWQTAPGRGCVKTPKNFSLENYFPPKRGQSPSA